MTIQQTQSLHDIAMHAFTDWVDQQILQTAESKKTQYPCSQTECIAHHALHTREDYMAILAQARDFKKNNDFIKAIHAVQKQIDARPTVQGHAHAVNGLKKVRHFNDNAQSMFSFVSLNSQKVFLKKIQTAFQYLHGAFNKMEDFGLMRQTPHLYLNELNDTLKKQGTFDEWKNLMAQRPAYQAFFAQNAIKKPQLKT